MKDIFIYTCYLSQLFLLVKSGRTVHNSLKCYQCETIGREPSAVCGEEDLKICPNDYAADRCLTNVLKNGTGHYHIIRRCALAPCDLPGIQSSLLKLSNDCDRNREEYNCFTCCEEDGCNRFNSSPSGFRFNSILTVIAIFVGLVLSQVNTDL